MENHPNSNASRARILVVDDHPTTAATLARAISQSFSGVEVISATNGKLALEQVRESTVDLVITDMMMPDMNGLELLEKLQSHPAGRPAYTILITAYDIPGLKETARRLKVNETIIKPIRPERICQAVEKFLQDMNHARAPERSEGVHPPFKILIADDISDNVSLLSRYLEKEGYGFVAAANGLETLEKTRSEMPDLILLDVNMPGKDGFEVLREIRADPVIDHIPVIILTAARPDPSDMQYGLNLGADDYVTKPFDRRELLARIHSKLRAKEAEEIIRRRYKELSVLPEIGQELSARLDINDLAEVVIRRCVETLGAMRGHMIVFDPKGPIQKTYAVSTAPASPAGLPNLDEWIRQIEETHQSVLIPDTLQEPRWQVAPGDLARSALIIPLIGRLDLIGLLVLTHELPGYFKSDHLLLSQALASQAAIAVENAQLHARVLVEQQRSAAILQSAADAILMFDAESRLLMSNPAGEKLFTDNQPKIGQPLEAGLGYDAFLPELEKALASKKAQTADISWPDHRSFSVHFTPVGEGGCVVMFHDVSRYQDLKRVTDEFISTASHNLKHPITVIAGFAQLLTQVGPLNERQLGYIGQINIAVQNMSVLIQNMLELIKADMGTGGELQRESMDLREVAAEVIFEFRPQAFARGQTLRLEEPSERLLAEGEPLQVRQVFRNLLNNAIKYTPNSGSITLSFGASNHQVMIKVQDSGYGIPARDLPFIFDRFYRVRNGNTKDIEGNGLGLAIVKSIIEKHGGQISVESQLGQGSCFTFTLPRVQPAQSADSGDAHSQTDSKMASLSSEGKTK